MDELIEHDDMGLLRALPALQRDAARYRGLRAALLSGGPEWQKLAALLNIAPDTAAGVDDAVDAALDVRGVPAKLVTHCPWCSAPVSVADEPYCANADCRWNNGGTPPNRTDEARDLIRRLVDAIDGNGATGDYLQRLRDEADMWLATQAASGVDLPDGGQHEVR